MMEEEESRLTNRGKNRTEQRRSAPERVTKTPAGMCSADTFVMTALPALRRTASDLVSYQRLNKVNFC
ncbi:hypothetical protein AOLI_G00157830 [Acnodon oligacanthus]